MIEIKVPTVGESISEVTLLKWTKKDGEYVDRDEVIAELESEKATFEVNAEKAGILKTAAREGDTLKIGDLLASIDDTAAKPVSAVPPIIENKEEKKKKADKAPVKEENVPPVSTETNIKASPVASAIIADKHVDTSIIAASGIGGKILKEDVLAALANPGKVTGGKALFSREERKEKMSQLRKTISRRLVDAKNSTAMLTTFNEADMSRIIEIRTKNKDKFKEIHGVGLGFMSFFAKACCIALQEWPAVNSYIDGDHLIYHDYCDISIAVSTPRGLTVPVIRNAESLSMSEIEKKVIELANKARDNKLSLEELQGGTFTITNGGVFGSLMSTPI
ncbi:MAG: 2-oxo acid dehydrogenase subunit E2, partial [Bacteroidetes bacterium]|nr:2-oxo acid dehydrogenase subunit E2 [Bacteroidota bacterium]